MNVMFIHAANYLKEGTGEQFRIEPPFHTINTTFAGAKQETSRTRGSHRGGVRAGRQEQGDLHSLGRREEVFVLKRKWKSLVAVLLVPVMVFALSGCSGGASSSSAEKAASNPVPEAMATDATPPVIVVSGSNEEMGQQYASQVPDLIYRNIVLLKSKITAQYGEELAKSDLQVWSYYADKHDPGLRGWIEGMQKGLKEAGYDVDYLDILLVTVYSGEMWCRPPLDQPYPEETGITVPESAAELARKDIHSCTAFAAEDEATPDGNPIIGVTKMITAEKVNSVVLVAFPDEGNSFVSNPMAGSMSENSGLNGEGFSWVFTAQWGEPIWGVANEVSFHYLDQYCGSPQDAVDFLESIPRAGVTGAFLLTAKDGGIQGYESLSNVSAERVPGDVGETGTFMAQTNHLVNPELQEYNGDGAVGGSADRYATMIAYLQEAASSGGITLDTAKKAFTSDDWLSAETGLWTVNDPGSESVNDSTESLAQSVFLPEGMTAFFEVGTPNGIGMPAGATGEYVELVLGDDPLAVAADAEAKTQEYYWTARNMLVKMDNAKDPKLTVDVMEKVRADLDVAAAEFEYAMDRAAFAQQAPTNGQSDQEQMALWGEAMTHYAKSQMYAQMASTVLSKL